MMSAEQNKTVTQVGPGTPMGNLLRRYWFPIAAVSELKDKFTKKVRLLGEDLVLYKDRSGNIGLIQERCPHRGVSMAYGMPAEEGLRCQYHGWCFNSKGNCTDQPNEPETSTFKDRIKIKAYEVQEMGGLFFAYLGPKPAPLLPRIDGFAVENAIRSIGHATLPVNFLQVMENSLDPAHTEWLHGHYAQFVKEQKGEVDENAFVRHHKKIAFDRFEYGIIKRRLFEGQSEESDDWKVGHPIVFPYILAVGGTAGEGSYAFQMRVPVDDETTWHVWYQAYAQHPSVEIPESLKEIPFYEVPYKNENGEYIVDYIDGQDIMCWITQGAIADRTDERLGTTDKGIIMYRQMIKEEIAKVERGEDPIGVIRDPEKNQFIELPLEKQKHHYSDGFDVTTKRFQTRFAPNVEDLIDFYSMGVK
ncbi:aromatic ring-hydroxylating dioxygenase subunit alpha [Bacillus sp. Marseille-P3661]|uniref:aromatic ring-hydroxylating dioxygenase subunit alpha n=1 Tax=Bacillus sp. Marseille-P3661 TaxID=1936234 RepID=UPI000C84D4EA|nr:aromatic ring-hydroxylating dioxygenase subunit alpha [Bacillus sp. Marseille-P3661]